MNLNIVVLNRCDTWLVRLNNPALICKYHKQLYEYRVCELHFGKSAFNNKRKGSLKWEAVPTLSLVTGKHSKNKGVTALRGLSIVHLHLSSNLNHSHASLELT